MKKIIFICVVWTMGFYATAHPADTDNDGKISIDEFLAFKKIQTDASGRPYNEKVQRDVFVKKDLDKDGFLSPKEMKFRPEH